jgi:hypothetical protein
MKQGVAQQPDCAGSPQQDAHLRSCRADQECAAEEHEDQSDIAQEVLVEGSGGRHAGHQHVPMFGRHQHEDAVGCQREAEQHGQAETYYVEHVLSSCRTSSLS